MKDTKTLWRFLPPDQRDLVDRIARTAAISREAAIALSLAQEAIRDYCPPAERVKVGALLAMAAAKGEPR